MREQLRPFLPKTLNSSAIFLILQYPSIKVLHGVIINKLCKEGDMNREKKKSGLKKGKTSTN